MAKTLSTLYSTLRPIRSTSPEPRVPCYLIVVDFPQAELCAEAMANLTNVHLGKKVDAWALTRDALGKESIELEFDGRVPIDSMLTLGNMVTESCIALRKAIEFIYRSTPYEVIIIGAEIDEDSESLWVWLDNPENPVQDRD